MLLASFSLPPGAIALEHTLAEVSEISIEAERIAAHSTEWTMPCLWVASDDFDPVDTALSTDPSVDIVIDMNEFDTERYYHIDWSDPVIDRIDTYTDKEGSILHASANPQGWEVQFRLASRDQLDTIRATLDEKDHSFVLRDLYEPGSPRATIEGVTPTQRTALITARERGYFKIPREITSRELAAELDMSHQSLSELLRRGTERLIDASLKTTGESP